MTSRPELAPDINYRNGIWVLPLFAVLAWTFLTAGFARPAGFTEGEITRSIGFAMFDMLELIPDAHGETEGFLVAFIVIAVVLDAALDGAVMLARREEDDSVITALADGDRVLAGGSESSDGTQADDGERSAKTARTDDKPNPSDGAQVTDGPAGGGDA